MGFTSHAPKPTSRGQTRSAGLELQLRAFVFSTHMCVVRVVPNLLAGLRLKRFLRRLCASVLKNCGIPNLAL